MICEHCNKEFNSYRSLVKHLKHKNITSKEYYDTYIKTNTDGICISCGKLTNFISIKLGYRKCCCSSCGAHIGQLKRYLNLEEHIKSAERTKLQMQSLTTRENLRNKAIKRFSDPKEREKISIAVKNSEKFNVIIHSPEYSNNMHNILIKRYSDEDARKKMSIACKNSKLSQKIKTSIEFREKHSNIMKNRIQNGMVNVKYKFDNRTFMSLPELCFYVYLKDHNIRFEYQCKPLNYIINDINKQYIPDFKVYNTYIEIKGPHLIKDGILWNPYDNCFNYEKTQCLIQNKVIIFTQEKYKKYIQYVKDKYGMQFINENRV